MMSWMVLIVVLMLIVVPCYRTQPGWPSWHRRLPELAIGFKTKKGRSVSGRAIQLVFQLAQRAQVLLATAEALDQLDRRAKLAERLHLQDFDLLDRLDALVGIFVQQRIQ